MSTVEKRRWSAEEKLQIVSEARASGSRVTEVCAKHGISSALYYKWEHLARSGALEHLQGVPAKRRSQEKEVRLQEEITRLREAVADLAQENVRLKRGLLG